MIDPVVILGAARTPLGRFCGALSGVPATALGAEAIRAAIGRSGIDPARVDEVLMGCVLSANLGQAPARQAAKMAGLADFVGATTINKICGSGLKSVMIASDAIKAGSADICVAGGMESMSNAPFLIAQHRAGRKIGHGALIDHLMRDGLEDAYDAGRAMGTFAEDTADQGGFDRASQDAFAIRSLTLAQSAVRDRTFAAEIAPVDLEMGGKRVLVSEDEMPGKLDPSKIPSLKPAFRPNGTVTAASSSANADGAAAVVLARRSTAVELCTPVLARVVAYATHSRKPEEFTVAPGPAIERVLKAAHWQAADVDLFEINEAFAVVVLAAMKHVGIPLEKVNVRGGACALGHPIGASGARVLVTLIHALRDMGKRRGVACLCIGGGEAVALAVEID